VSLDLFTFISGDGADYAEYLKYTCEKNLSGIHKINWKCVESLDVSRLPAGYECVCETGGEGRHNATKHALAIEGAMDHIESEYVLFTDTDVAIVYNGWDDVIIEKLKNCDCFGGAYVKTKHDKFKKRYKNFPKANFFAFRADVLNKVILNFKPFRYGKFWGTVNKRTSAIFDMKIGERIAYDIGWRLPGIFKHNNLTYDFMPCYFMTSEKSKLPYLNEEHKWFCKKKGITMEEWHYNGELFATHKKHARYNNLNSKWGLAWKTRVDLYMNRGDWYEDEEKLVIRNKRKHYPLEDI